MVSLHFLHSARGNPIPGISSATPLSFHWTITEVRVAKASQINKWLQGLKKKDELMVNMATHKVKRLMSRTLITPD